MNRVERGGEVIGIDMRGTGKTLETSNGTDPADRRPEIDLHSRDVSSLPLAEHVATDLISAPIAARDTTMRPADSSLFGLRQNPRSQP